MLVANEYCMPFDTNYRRKNAHAITKMEKRIKRKSTVGYRNGKSNRNKIRF